MRYIGLDVHKTSSTFVVLSEGGKQLDERVVETNGASLVEYLKLTPGHKRLCLEEGTQSQWLFEILAPHVEDLVVLHLDERSRGQKNDSLDARRLAEKIRIGDCPTQVFKDAGKFGRLRALVFVYNKLVQDQTRTKNRIHAIFRAWGQPLASKKIFANPLRTQELSELPGKIRKSAEILFFQHDVMADMVDEAAREVAKEAERFPVYRILRTCPGIGVHRAAEIMAIVITPQRFRSRRQYWSYAGFGVVTRSSADWAQGSSGDWHRTQRAMTRGLNRKRHGRLKHIYKAAALSVLGQKHGALYEYYKKQLRQGTNPNIAKVSLARKIAVTTWSMWKNMEAFKE